MNNAVIAVGGLILAAVCFAVIGFLEARASQTKNAETLKEAFAETGKMLGRHMIAVIGLVLGLFVLAVGLVGILLSLLKI